MDDKRDMVLGFSFSKYYDKVLLILKNRPEWQAGDLNGVGGHIKENESPLQAMEREMLEEAGLGPLDAIEPWKLIAVGQCRMDAKLHIFANRAQIDECISMTDERISIEPIVDLPENIISNLRWLIPLCIDQLRNHEMCRPLHFSYI
jgi:8-oxo-dGTP pyrophosphatase MutT (NUDIX family)